MNSGKSIRQVVDFDFGEMTGLNFFLATREWSFFSVLRVGFEFLLALFLLIAFAPLLLVLGLVIKLNSRGPALYTQIRVGKGGRAFKIYKLRTMVEDAEKDSGPVLATKGDQRVTPLGRFLRKTHLDEIPQLINVLKGDMSFIGPRPERPKFVAEFDKTVKNYTMRKLVRPGITGLAQICLSYEALPECKIVFDVIYIQNSQSPLLNLFIVYYTVKKILFPWKFHPLDLDKDKVDSEDPFTKAI